MSYFDRWIQKYNHNHDEKGRFATSNEVKNLASRISKPDGGFTYQPTTHKEPKSGYAVSPYPEHSFAIDSDKFTIAHLAKYVRKNRSRLAKADHYVGAWHDPASGKIFLDISVVKSKATDAAKLARDYDQIAYFDLKAGKSVTINANATSGGVVKTGG